jgi:serine/threonine-protein kinase
MFQAGQQIGPYTLVRGLGRGGFGEVWLAERHTPLLTTKVAVKLPLDTQIDLEVIKEEAVLWEHASGHPNVLPIIEANIYNDQVLIASEYAPDGSLADKLKEQGSLPAERAVEITLGILEGLEFLHSRRIIHRDLKPANVLMQGKTPRLTDFGISRILESNSTDHSLNLAGTPLYMSPEAFDGMRNTQTDIWSVGVILYELLSGAVPFPQQDFPSLVKAIRISRPASLSDAVPGAIGDIVFHALAKSWINRYKSAAIMREELQKARNAHPSEQDKTIPNPENSFIEVSPDDWGKRPTNRIFEYIRSLFEEK